MPTLASPGTFVINGIKVTDPVYKQYFDSAGMLTGIGSTQDNGYGVKTVTAVQKKQADGTWLTLVPADDLSHYVAVNHYAADNKTLLSAVTMSGQKLVGYIQQGQLTGAVSDGGGAVPLAALGIPNAVGSAASGIGGQIASGLKSLISTPFMVRVGEALLGVLVLVIAIDLFFKSQSTGSSGGTNIKVGV